MKKYEILNGNTLKIIALISMIIDHVGVMIFPSIIWLRCLGRISLPIFAYMISEGCQYTRNPKKYFFRIFILGVLCQAVYLFAAGTLYLSTVVSFSFSVLAIFFIKNGSASKETRGRVLYFIAFSLLALLMLFLLFPPKFMAPYGLVLDYGIFPFLIPIVLYFLKSKELRILALIPLLYLLSLSYDFEQLFSFAAIPVLALYNGERGKKDLKYFFYIAYPLHLGLIFIFSMFI